MRIRLVPEKTNIDFFRLQYVTFGASIAAVLATAVLVMTMGLNFGIDFRGGTTIRTESITAVDVGVYRDALTPLDLVEHLRDCHIAPLDLGDVAISQCSTRAFAKISMWR
jgi:preprotein translocase subunit SecF